MAWFQITSFWTCSNSLLVGLNKILYWGYKIICITLQSKSTNCILQSDKSVKAMIKEKSFAVAEIKWRRTWKKNQITSLSSKNGRQTGLLDLQCRCDSNLFWPFWHYLANQKTDFRFQVFPVGWDCSMNQEPWKEFYLIDVEGLEQLPMDQHLIQYWLDPLVDTQMS